jgi:hypothetical protein
MDARTGIFALALLSACSEPGDATTQAYAPSTSTADAPHDESSAGGTTRVSDDASGSTGDAPAVTSSDDGASAASSDDGTTGDAPLPEFDDIPWQTGDDIGYGVAYKDLGDPDAHHAFIGYAGYPFPLDAAQSWVRELWLARLRELGVRYVWAVQGPATVSYSGLEVGNTSIAARLVEQLDDEAKVIVAGHSSGSYVAHELLGQLAGDWDPGGVTADKVIYFDLDGGVAGLYDAGVQRLHRAYFVGIYDSRAATASPNLEAMQYLDSMWHAKGGYLEVEGSGSGCNAGAPWCLHMVVISTLPHDPNDSDVIDYLDFVDRPVATEWLDRVADDAGLAP